MHFWSPFSAFLFYHKQVWTDGHIEELANDFIVIPKDTPVADVAPGVHGEWLNIDGDYTFAACSICKMAYEVATEEEAEKGLWDAFMCSYRYCPNCGAKMDGGMKHDKP